MKRTFVLLRKWLCAGVIVIAAAAGYADLSAWREDSVQKCIQNLKGDEWANVQELPSTEDMTALTRRLCLHVAPWSSNRVASTAVKLLVDHPKAKLGFCAFMDAGVAYEFASWKTSLIERPVYFSADGVKVAETDPVAFVRSVLNLDSREYQMKGLPDGKLIDGHVVRGSFSGRDYASPFDSGWFYFIDDRPYANWSHPCRYVFVSADRTRYVVVYSNEPPAVFNGGQEVELAQVAANLPSGETRMSLKQFRNAVNAVSANSIDYSGDASHSYAVLISGGGNKDSNYSRYWGDVAMVYSTLTLKYGMPKANIRVCMSDGASTAADMCNTDTERYQDSPKDLDGDGVADIGYDAKKATIKSVLSNLASSLTSDDQLFVFITDHGAQDSSTGISYLVPWLDGSTGRSAYISPSELSSWIAAFNCPVALAMEYCYSGPFISPIVKTTRRAVATACGNEPSSAFCWTDPTGTYSGAIRVRAFHYCNPYAWAFNAAIRGADSLWGFSPWKDSSPSEVKSADSNGDGRVSFYEAAQCAEDYILNTTQPYRSTVFTFGDTPQYGESTSGVGSTFFMLKKETSYTVTYCPGSYGTGSQQTATKTSGTALTLKGAIFTRAGYAQTGWATSDGGAKDYALGATYTKDAAITLYPVWTEKGTDTGGFVEISDFESFAAGTSVTTGTIEPLSSDGSHWYSTSSEPAVVGTCDETYSGACGQPYGLSGQGDHCLTLETPFSEAIWRTANPLDGNAAEPKAVGNSLTFDFLAILGSLDEYPDLDGMEIAQNDLATSLAAAHRWSVGCFACVDDKLAVYCHETEDEEGEIAYEFHILAGALNATSGAIEERTYAYAPENLDPQVWNRVSIRATTIGGHLRFSVYFNGVLLTDEPVYARPGTEANLSVTALGFAGQGSVDNIVISERGPVWANDPIPALPDNPTAADVADALSGTADEGLGKNITTPEGYDDFRAWAARVKDPGGTSAAGLKAVRDAPHAWLSYALDSATLIAETPTADDLKVDAFAPSSESGKFDFTVSVTGVTVGSAAQKENLKRVFGLEGATALGEDGFSSANVDIVFGTPQNGKVRFTAGPGSGSVGTDTFFMRVKMTP